MVEDFEVDWDLFEVKKKLLKFETKHKTRIYFWDFVNAVHKIVKNCERRSQLWTGIVNGDCERTRHHGGTTPTILARVKPRREDARQIISKFESLLP
jgi:hypothetical protein